jgi:putative ATP-binding cassette transporter
MTIGREEAPPPAGIDRAIALQFMGYTRGFWRGPSARTAWLFTLGLAGCLFLKLLVDVATNRWNRWFFDALEKKDAASAGVAVLAYLGLVMAVAAVGVGIVLTREGLQVRWRKWCTDKLLDNWLAKQRFYRMSASGGAMQNPEYRISDDVRMATEPLTDFAIMLFTAFLALVTFAGILWSVGGALDVTIGGTTFSIPAFMLLGAIVYGVTMSAIIPVVGKNLSVAAARKNEAEAKFRFEMIRLRENSEGVIMARGEQYARDRLFDNYAHLVRTWMEVVRQHGLITWVTNSNGAMIPVVPLVLCAPKYLDGQLTLGEVMQLASAFIQVQVAIGWLVDHYRAIAEWFASARRITELADSFAETDAAAAGPASRIVRVTNVAGDIHLDNLRLVDPSGRTVIVNANVRIRSGEKVRLIGEAGTGKGVLVRAIGGLWPWGEGAVSLPEGRSMGFVAEAPYLIDGLLRETLVYPSPLADFDDADMRHALAAAGLERLATQLDEYGNWDQTLSASERQRLAIARLLLQRPDIIVLEDALSALDPSSQADLFAQIVRMNPVATILFVGGKASPAYTFDRTLHFMPGDGGSHLAQLDDATAVTQQDGGALAGA